MWQSMQNLERMMAEWAHQPDKTAGNQHNNFKINLHTASISRLYKTKMLRMCHN